MNTIFLRLIRQSLPSMLILLPCLIVIRILYLHAFHKTVDIKHEILFFIFLCWIVLMVSLTMLSEIQFTLHGIYVNPSGLTGINLKLFRVFKDVQIIAFKNGYWPYLWINFIGNLLLFIPFGFLLPLLFKSCSFLKVFLYSFLFSCMIEIIQLMLPRGTDIDDVWLNSLGGIIGWILFKIFNSMKNKV